MSNTKLPMQRLTGELYCVKCVVLQCDPQACVYGVSSYDVLCAGAMVLGEKCVNGKVKNSAATNCSLVARKTGDR